MLGACVQVGDRSSRFYPNAERIRTKGNYVYEELFRNGKDLKVNGVFIFEVTVRVA